jgi:hypothetical protein
MGDGKWYPDPMLNKKLFKVLQNLKACPESIAYLKTQTDPVAAVRGLRPEWKDWIAETAELPCYQAKNEARATAAKAYDEAEAPARKAYYEATATAWKAFDEATATALKAFDGATATAQKAFNEATETAWKAYDKAIDGEILTWYYQL